MREGTTKPNGSRKMNVEETETENVQKRMENAGYNVKINGLEARFVEEKIKEEGSNSGSSSSEGTKKAGNHTLVPNEATVAFKPLIPYIANGAKANLKDNKNKGKDKKASQTKNNKTDRESKEDRV